MIKDNLFIASIVIAFLISVVIIVLVEVSRPQQEDSTQEMITSDYGLELVTIYDGNSKARVNLLLWTDPVFNCRYWIRSSYSGTMMSVVIKPDGRPWCEAEESENTIPNQIPG